MLEFPGRGRGDGALAVSENRTGRCGSRSVATSGIGGGAIGMLLKVRPHFWRR
jgi:hypothetical protein